MQLVTEVRQDRSSIVKIHVNSGERSYNFTSGPAEPGPPLGPDSPVAP